MKMCFPFFLLYLDTFSIKQKERGRRPRTFSNFFNCSSCIKNSPCDVSIPASDMKRKSQLPNWSESCKKTTNSDCFCHSDKGTTKVFYRFEKSIWRAPGSNWKCQNHFVTTEIFIRFFFFCILGKFFLQVNFISLILKTRKQRTFGF